MKFNTVLISMIKLDPYIKKLIVKSNVVLTSCIIVGAVMLLPACATLINDPAIPLAFSFSDGSAGKCTFKNKRGVWESDIPTKNVMIRRSDDTLNYTCATRDGRKVSGSIKSEIEGGKLAASVVFFDFGITDAITDKHRTYAGGNISIPVLPGKSSSNS